METYTVDILVKSLLIDTISTYVFKKIKIFLRRYYQLVYEKLCIDTICIILIRTYLSIE